MRKPSPTTRRDDGAVGVSLFPQNSAPGGVNRGLFRPRRGSTYPYAFAERDRCACRRIYFFACYRSFAAALSIASNARLIAEPLRWPVARVLGGAGISTYRPGRARGRRGLTWICDRRRPLWLRMTVVLVSLSTQRVAMKSCISSRVSEPSLSVSIVWKIRS